MKYRLEIDFNNAEDDMGASTLVFETEHDGHRLLPIEVFNLCRRMLNICEEDSDMAGAKVVVLEEM